MLKYTSALASRSFSRSVNQKTREGFHCLRPRNVFVRIRDKPLLKEDKVFVKLSSGVLHKNASRDSVSCRLISSRSFSSSDSQKLPEGIEKPLPWLVQSRVKATRRPQEVVTTKTSKSSWEESATKFLKGGAKEKGVQGSESRQHTYGGRREVMAEEREEEEEAGEAEEIDNPRWDKIKNRFSRTEDVKPGSNKPEFKRLNKQESWGRKTWKEATESTVPKIVGEGIYGIGPILAALSAERREFYALYVQEGIDLSGNNKRKKDKKGFEKILHMAERIGLSIKEVSKHDLNMVADNRPHQGLILDASPLEMVSIKELEPVSVEDDSGPLWVALDEVTDPQNLGAIIRSSYYFGASGVVLCAKNSAPLSGVVSKASAGSLELMEIRSCKNMMQFLSASAENGWRVLGGSVSSRAVPLHKVVPGAPTILVLGSEGTGLRPLVERSCTQLIRIPGNVPVDVSSGEGEDLERSEGIRGPTGQEFKSFMAVESLNVSVAAGVLLHHLTLNRCSNNESSEEKLTTIVE
ncbi:OLC1v1037556C1 [Oldenlandia corymbosa var. corymbosa]|uniref:rRNA methyltransferase 1, mitochondrial n=1 Tax=Oldenlandia corymbosa var. corymbosa TaxID=529605 RepID=A0AAV1CZ41_OLDCO|nr:OLC1v1037556C1 [Oldenlandia corymbosa var. corymbosa]